MHVVTEEWEKLFWMPTKKAVCMTPGANISTWMCGKNASEKTGYPSISIPQENDRMMRFSLGIFWIAV